MSRWETVRDLFEQMGFYNQGPYPADHGKQHVRIVVESIQKILKELRESSPSALNPDAEDEILAAAVTHDIAMTLMIPLGDRIPEARRARDRHAQWDVLRDLSEREPVLRRAGFDVNASERILRMAWAHAKDDKDSAEAKLQFIREKAREDLQAVHMPLGVAALRLADFLDLGPDRLVRNVGVLKFDRNQFPHLRKHEALRVSFDAPARHILLSLDKAKETSSTDVAVLLQVHEEASRAVRLLNEECSLHHIHWHLEPLPPGYGTVHAEGGSLFSNAFHEMDSSEHVLEIDMLGHSLYGRFVEDAENLNEDIKKLLEDGRLRLRVILLDPAIENQQTLEVHEAQRSDPSEEGRSILPILDIDGNVIRKGDILSSLKVLENWAKLVKGQSFLEARVTTRLMYASHTRFGRHMVVTHYLSKGLSNQSGRVRFSDISSIYGANRSEFESIWTNPAETRLYVHRHGSPERAENPANFLMQAPVSGGHFDYEHSLLTSWMSRVREWTRKGSGPVPLPFEIEIQPSARCTLHCEHCIGARLTRPDAKCEHVRSVHLNKLLPLMGGGKIERCRISGLFGDPLATDESMSLTLDFVKKTKKAGCNTVVFTNGARLRDRKVREGLSLADCVHISLDAATSGVFANTKHVGTGVFNDILEGTRQLVAIGGVVGIGYVVTNANSHHNGTVDPLEEAIKLAKACGASFIRFKPDIRYLTQMATWQDARSRILKFAHQYRTEKFSVSITDVSAQQRGLAGRDRCWMQRLSPCIGPDGRVYPCDHLVAAGPEASLGDLKKETFVAIWKRASREKKLGRRNRYCEICPPFAGRMNRLLGNVEVLRESYGWRRVNRWVEQALSTCDGAGDGRSVAGVKL